MSCALPSLRACGLAISRGGKTADSPHKLVRAGGVAARRAHGGDARGGEGASSESGWADEHGGVEKTREREMRKFKDAARRASMVRKLVEGSLGYLSPPPDRGPSRSPAQLGHHPLRLVARPSIRPSTGYLFTSHINASTFKAAPANTHPPLPRSPNLLQASSLRNEVRDVNSYRPLPVRGPVYPVTVVSFAHDQTLL